MKKNILITGGAGFIGSEITKILYSSGEYQVTVFDLLTKQIHGEKPYESYLFKQIEDKCSFIRGDVSNYSEVEKALEGQDYVIHLAAETGTGQSMYEINHYNNVNIMGLSNVLQAIMVKKLPVKKIILSSSRSVYGEGKYRCKKHGEIFPQSRDVERMSKGDFGVYCPVCGEKLEIALTDENSKILPNSLYAFTKFAQENMIETMCPKMNIDYTIFRFQNVYGVGQSLKNPYTGILSIFSTLLLENKKVNIFEDGNESRDFVNVTDVADAVARALDCPESNSRIMNIGSGQKTTVSEIASLLKKIYKSSSEIVITGDFRKGDIANNIADISRAKEILGFAPSISLEKGLEYFCAWVKGQDIDNTGYEKSLIELENKNMLVRGNTACTVEK